MQPNETPHPEMRRECDHCHRVQLCTWSLNPYVAEIHPEIDSLPSWWCDDCYDGARDDI